MAYSSYSFLINNFQLIDSINMEKLEILNYIKENYYEDASILSHIEYINKTYTFYIEIYRKIDIYLRGGLGGCIIPSNRHIAIKHRKNVIKIHLRPIFLDTYCPQVVDNFCD